MQKITGSSKDTQKLALDFAKQLKGGEVLALTGDLGSGKTTFVQGLAKGLGVKDNITSPTFIILNLHQSKKGLKLAHFDLYRLGSAEDLQSIAMNDYISKKNIIAVIEWAEKVKKDLPKSTIWIKFEHISENERKIIIKD